jgi:hypothetical protein
VEVLIFESHAIRGARLDFLNWLRLMREHKIREHDAQLVHQACRATPTLIPIPSQAPDERLTAERFAVER